MSIWPNGKQRTLGTAAGPDISSSCVYYLGVASRRSSRSGHRAYGRRCSRRHGVIHALSHDVSARATRKGTDNSSSRTAPVRAWSVRKAAKVISRPPPASHASYNCLCVSIIRIGLQPAAGQTGTTPCGRVGEDAVRLVQVVHGGCCLMVVDGAVLLLVWMRPPRPRPVLGANLLWLWAS